MPTRKPAIPKASATPPPAKRGRPAYVPTDKNRETVRLLCAGGITHDRIAVLLGVSESTIERHFKSDIAMGKLEIDLLSVNTLITAMREGGKDGLTAAIWWQKSRMGWTERVVVDDLKPNVPMRVIVELVGDAPPAQITHQAPRSRYESGPHVQLIG